MMQIAIALGLIWYTTNIKAAYLNVLTKLEPFVPEISGLDPIQLYRIDKYLLYGLQDTSTY